jgi:hypothetical protein
MLAWARRRLPASGFGTGAIHEQSPTSLELDSDFSRSMPEDSPDCPAAQKPVRARCL